MNALVLTRTTFTKYLHSLYMNQHQSNKYFDIESTSYSAKHSHTTKKTAPTENFSFIVGRARLEFTHHNCRAAAHNNLLVSRE